ncbi:FAD-dependent oxidoreductase [Tannockella kyphosi]|uniref:FAD-dependent oxidoreductase n=1 Tax=Tannockella kyphosi TaxID=2899121 RepID=UPI002011B956|nr:FAD-dependent oxidoreductase [Tannockella kyphosi]
MKKFGYKSAKSFDEAAEIIKANENSVPVSGGTDLIFELKSDILTKYPEELVSLRKVDGGSYVTAQDGTIKIGAITKLGCLEKSEELLAGAPALSQAAKSVATPLVRNSATIGGNVCQDVRCWYYRYPEDVGGKMVCQQKGGEECFAVLGENRYHSVFGGMKIVTSACTKGCPAGTDVSSYMGEIRKGNWDEAAKIIMRVNPMPMCTSRICPHPCEDRCNHDKNGDSVAIHCVERTLGDYILENKEKFYVAPKAETGKSVGIIGAGPGGLTAAYYLRSQGHSVTVIDSHEKAGGVLMYGIPHYRLPKDIVEGYASALEGMGVTFEMNTTVGKEISMEEVEGRFDTVFFGTGAWKQPVLGITGEELTQFGLDFLQDVNTFLQKATGENVLVCGGGNVAMDVALTARRLGAKSVKLVCLESREAMPATKEEIARALEEGIEIENGWGLKGVIKDADGKVSGLESMKCVSVFDEKNRFAPVYDHDETTVFTSDSIILATGQRVDVDFLGDEFASQIKSERGLLEVDEETYQTKNEKFFAGGDVVTGPNIAIRAIHAGNLAAHSMSAKMGYPIKREASEKGYKTFDVEGVKVEESCKLEELPVASRTLVDEDEKSLSLELASKEAKRCMNCGCYSVNASDISPVLVMLDGTIVTTKKEIKAVDFFTTKLKTKDMLEHGELVTEIQVPVLEGYTSSYDKFRVRDGMDFAIVSLSSAFKVVDGVIEDAKLVLGGVAPVPYKLDEVEAFLKGKAISEEVAESAGALAIKDAIAMEHNNYKITEIKALVIRNILAVK